jgi:hypothetical protein
VSADLIAFPGTPLPAPAEPAAPAQLSYIEPSVAPEFFCGDLARVHLHGPFARLIWTVPDTPGDAIDADRGAHNVATCKIVVPTESLQAIHDALGKAIAARAAVLADD